MDFSLSSLFAGFVFGTFGIYALREGKRSGDFRKAMIGVAMLGYGFFVTNPWLNWGIGSVLLFLLFYWK